MKEPTLIAPNANSHASPAKIELTNVQVSKYIISYNLILYYYMVFINIIDCDHRKCGTCVVDSNVCDVACKDTCGLCNSEGDCISC